MTSEWQEAASFFTPEQASLQDADETPAHTDQSPDLVGNTSSAPSEAALASDHREDQRDDVRGGDGSGDPRVAPAGIAQDQQRDEQADADGRPFTVVVGVSPTSGSPYALAWAAAEARSHGGRVVAVQAWKPVVPSASRRPPAAPSAHDDTSVETEARRELLAAVSRVLGDEHPDVECRLVRGGRRTVLAAASEDADLLVLDAARIPEFGSQSRLTRRVVGMASCPVVVMPPSLAGSTPSWLAHILNALGRRAVRAAGQAGRPGGMPTGSRRGGSTVEHPAEH